MKKILHVTYGFNGGGVGFVIANYCARKKYENICFDIVGEDIGKNHLLHKDFEEAGFNIFYVTPKKSNLIKNICEMFSLIRKGHYDGVHVHFEEWSFLYLMLAWICRVPIRVCHAHMAYMEGSSTKPHYTMFRWLLNRFATLRLACSKDAGDHLYGRNPYHVLNNAIDAEKFVFSQEIRTKKRKELNVDGKLVIGTVGRLSYQKNPQFMVDIFNSVCAKNDNAVLLFIGQGELENETKQKVQNLGLAEKVKFLGIRTDVPELLQAMDVFVLPSRFEGLGIVYVEAQAAGLPAFATANVVPTEACMTEELFTYLPQNASADEWADQIIQKQSIRRDTSEIIRRKGYDIELEIAKLEQLYHEGCE